VQQAFRAHSSHEHAKLEERRNVLRRRLNAWTKARNLYIPIISDVHATTSPTEFAHVPVTSPIHLPEAIPLRLPSALMPSFLQTSSLFKLNQVELRFRLAQAEDSLSELHRLLRITMSLGHYKSKHIGYSQLLKTRADKLKGRFYDKVSRCAERYKAACSALLALDPMGEWQGHLLQLKDEDIHPPGRRDGESEGSREVPWIWRTMPITPRPVEEQASSVEQSETWSNEELDRCEHMS
jgi:hypothetical protein